jgi:peptide deformylase
LALLPIHTYGHPILRKKAKPVRQVDDQLTKFVSDMFETMHHANGIGLAATQVGSLHRVIVVDISDVEEKTHEGVGGAVDALTAPVASSGLKKLVLINPEVVSSAGSWTMEEGCLSIPEVRDEVERPETVRVTYKDLEMRDHALQADGLLGRVLLHEIDHLNGILFIDRLGRVKRKLLRGRLNKIEKGLVEVPYPILTAEDIAEPAR